MWHCALWLRLIDTIEFSWRFGSDKDDPSRMYHCTPRTPFFPRAAFLTSPLIGIYTSRNINLHHVHVALPGRHPALSLRVEAIIRRFCAATFEPGGLLGLPHDVSCVIHITARPCLHSILPISNANAVSLTRAIAAATAGRVKAIPRETWSVNYNIFRSVYEASWARSNCRQLSPVYPPNIMKYFASLFAAAAVLARGVLSADPLAVNTP